MQTRKQKIEREIHILFIEKYLSLLIDAKKKSSLAFVIKKGFFSKTFKRKKYCIVVYLYPYIYTIHYYKAHKSAAL